MKILVVMQTIHQNNKVFFYLIVLLLLFGLVPLFLFDKVSFFFTIKQWESPILDCCTPYLSYLGDVRAYWVVVLIIKIKHFNKEVSYLIRDTKIVVWMANFLFMSLVVQFLKRIVFSHILRPMALISIDQVHIIKGVELAKKLSFPSGHASTIFSIITLIQLFKKEKSFICSFLLCLLACVVSYSRIYLCQHFYTDVYFGGLIGILSAYATYSFTMSTK